MSAAVTLRGEVRRLDMRRRVATIALPSLGAGSFRTAVALPGETLAAVVGLDPGSRAGGTVGSVTAVRPRSGGVDVDVHVTDEAAWQRLAEPTVDVHAEVSFNGSGLTPTGGVVHRVEIG